jgi:hypothetical protein
MNVRRDDSFVVAFDFVKMLIMKELKNYGGVSYNFKKVIPGFKSGIL